MKELLILVCGALLMGGYIAWAFGTIASIGYFFYMWHTGIVLATAAWGAFIFWIQLMVSGGVAFVVGLVGLAANSQ